MIELELVLIYTSKVHNQSLEAALGWETNVHKKERSACQRKTHQNSATKNWHEPQHSSWGRAFINAQIVFIWVCLINVDLDSGTVKRLWLISKLHNNNQDVCGCAVRVILVCAIDLSLHWGNVKNSFYFISPLRAWFIYFWSDWIILVGIGKL